MSRYNSIYRNSLHNYLASSLNIFIDKTPVPSSGVLFTHLSINKKPYYSGSLSLNKSIDLTSTDL